MTIECPHCQQPTVLSPPVVNGAGGLKIAKQPQTQSATVDSQGSRMQSTSTSSRSAPKPAGKDWFVTFLLACFLGGLGADRFYCGRTGLGLAKLFTCGVCGLWTLVDCILLLAGKYQDGQHNSLSAANRGQWVTALVILLVGALVGVAIQFLGVGAGLESIDMDLEPPEPGGF